VRFIAASVLRSRASLSAPAPAETSPMPNQCTEQAALHAGYAGVHRAQIVAAPRGDQHKRHNSHFEEYKASRAAALPWPRDWAHECESGCGTGWLRRGGTMAAGCRWKPSGSSAICKEGFMRDAPCVDRAAVP